MGKLTARAITTIELACVGRDETRKWQLRMARVDLCWTEAGRAS